MVQHLVKSLKLTKRIGILYAIINGTSLNVTSVFVGTLKLHHTSIDQPLVHLRMVVGRLAVRVTAILEAVFLALANSGHRVQRDHLGAFS